MSEFYYSDLSEKIIGLLFDVYNAEGYGYQEAYYEDELAQVLFSQGIKFQKQFLIRIQTKSGQIVKRRADFNIEDKMLLELKVGRKWAKKDFDQANEYLKAIDYRLCLLILFSPKGVKVRRIINEK